MKVHATIEGIKPILMHKFNIESLTSLTKVKSGNSGNDPEEWKNSFFHDGKKLYIPGSYIFSALKNGAVHTKVGRGTLQKTWISAVTVEEEKIYFNREIWDNWEDTTPDEIPTDSNQPVYVDVRMVANPNTKGRNVRYRLALSPGWEISFSIEVDSTILSKSHVQKVIEDTGKLQGIADARTLGYGRYKVVELDID